jgi:hypothetical protein
MLKRVVLTLLITVAASFAFSLLFVGGRILPTFLGPDVNLFVIAALLLVGAVFLCRHGVHWPHVFLLSCAGALLAAQSVDLIISIAVLHPQMWPWLTSQLFYLDTINPWVWKSAHVLRLFGLFFPLPLFAVIWSRLTPTSNQSLEPTAGRCEAHL